MTVPLPLSTTVPLVPWVIPVMLRVSPLSGSLSLSNTERATAASTAVVALASAAVGAAMPAAGRLTGQPGVRREPWVGGASAVAAWPALAAAQAGGSRAIGLGDDFWKVTLVTALGVGVLFLVAAIGYLYRRERGLSCGLQLPDPDEHHDEEH